MMREKHSKSSISSGKARVEASPNHGPTSKLSEAVNQKYEESQRQTLRRNNSVARENAHTRLDSIDYRRKMEERNVRKE